MSFIFDPSIASNFSKNINHFFRWLITVSVLAFTAMALLAFFEFFVYQDTWMKYEYEVDKDFTR